MSRELLSDGEIAFEEEDLKYSPQKEFPGCSGARIKTIFLSVLMFVLVAGVLTTAVVYLSNERLLQESQRLLAGTRDSIYQVATQVALEAESTQAALSVTQGALNAFEAVLQQHGTVIAANFATNQAVAAQSGVVTPAPLLMLNPVPTQPMSTPIVTPIPAIDPYTYIDPGVSVIDEDFDFITALNTEIWDYLPDRWAINSSDCVALQDNAWLLTRSTSYSNYVFLVDFVPSEQPGDYVFAFRTRGRAVDFLGSLSFILSIDDQMRLSASIYYIDSLDDEGSGFTYSRPRTDAHELPVLVRSDGGYQLTMRVRRNYLSVTLDGSTSQTWHYPLLEMYRTQVGFQVPAGTQIRRIFIGPL